MTGLSASAVADMLRDTMSHLALAQADLFGTDPEDRGASRATVVPIRGRRTAAPNPGSAAQLLDGHDDHRVLRRLKPRPVGPAYRLGPGESIAVLVDVETTGLDHRTHEVIEIGMVAFVHDAEGRIGPVVGVVGMLHKPRGEISAEITRLTGITAQMVTGKVLDMAAIRALLEMGLGSLRRRAKA